MPYFLISFFLTTVIPQNSRMDSQSEFQSFFKNTWQGESAESFCTSFGYFLTQFISRAVPVLDQMQKLSSAAAQQDVTYELNFLIRFDSAIHTTDFCR